MSLLQSLNTISKLDSGNIFVENIRSIYKIPRLEARILCEMAVKQNLFVKKIGVTCPAPSCHQRIIADYNSYSEIPNEVSCHICEAEDVEQFIYKTANLKKVEYYQLIE